jgi:hypothetical protein
MKVTKFITPAGGNTTMPLNFKFPETTDRAIIEYKRDDGKLYWHPRAEVFIYYQMLLQHDLTGEMTDDKLIEIARRIALIDLFHVSPQLHEGDESYRVQLADVIAYWGLSTNCSHLTRTKWDAYYNRCFLKRDAKDVIERLRVRVPMHKNTKQDAIGS